MVATLSPEVNIVATDLNVPMIDRACAVGLRAASSGARPMRWTCPSRTGALTQWSARSGAILFFPDRATGILRDATRARPGGSLLFNTWDRIGENEFADVVTASLQALSDDPPLFLRRTPHGYFDTDLIRSDSRKRRFRHAAARSTLAARSSARSPQVPAIAYRQGTPLRNEITARGPSRPGDSHSISQPRPLPGDSVAERWTEKDLWHAAHVELDRQRGASGVPLVHRADTPDHRDLSDCCRLTAMRYDWRYIRVRSQPAHGSRWLRSVRT